MRGPGVECPERVDGKSSLFGATHWSVVLAAGQVESRRGQEALEMLCRTYWQPIFSWLRSSGYEHQDAQDLTQGFLAHLLRNNPFAGLSPDRGKFRSFLLKALQHYLRDHRDSALAAKRGSGVPPVPLEYASEDRFAVDAVSAETPEAAFDRRWALLLLDRAFHALRQEFVAMGKTEQFAELAPFLAKEGCAGEYASAASKLRVTAGAVAVAVHRLRVQYRDCIRNEIAQTVISPREVRQEMRYLLEVLCRNHALDRQAACN